MPGVGPISQIQGHIVGLDTAANIASHIPVIGDFLKPLTNAAKDFNDGPAANPVGSEGGIPMMEGGGAGGAEGAGAAADIAAVPPIV